MTSRTRIPEERTQALAMPVSTSNIRSIKMDIAAEEEKEEGENQIIYIHRHAKYLPLFGANHVNL